MNKFEFITVYNSKKYQPNEIFASDHGRYKILGRTSDPKCDQYVIEFLATGFQSKVRTSSIKKGMVKDPLVPNLYCRGYLGVGKEVPYKNGKCTRAYKLWTGMFDRCYGVGGESYKARGVEVSEDWFCFQTFAKDIKELEGYDAWLNGYGMALDKDIKYNGTYSKESCMFITKSQNSIEMNQRKNR